MHFSCPKKAHRHVVADLDRRSHLVIMLPNQPFLDWLLGTDEDTSATLTLHDLRRDPEVYLVPDKVGELPEDVEKWVYERWRGVFEHLLHSWYTDESASGRRTAT